MEISDGNNIGNHFFNTLMHFVTKYFGYFNANLVDSLCVCVFFFVASLRCFRIYSQTHFISVQVDFFSHSRPSLQLVSSLSFVSTLFSECQKQCEKEQKKNNTHTKQEKEKEMLAQRRERRKKYRVNTYTNMFISKPLCRQ